jgi:hypothetical protein
MVFKGIPFSIYMLIELWNSVVRRPLPFSFLAIITKLSFRKNLANFKSLSISMYLR